MKTDEGGEDDDVELDTEDPESVGAGSRGAKTARFVVENDNDGTEIRLKAKFTVKIAKVIDRMYVQIGRARQDGDRLTRVSDGSNVFDSAEVTVAEYVGDDHKRIRWAFVGEQGGAAR